MYTLSLQFRIPAADQWVAFAADGGGSYYTFKTTPTWTFPTSVNLSNIRLKSVSMWLPNAQMEYLMLKPNFITRPTASVMFSDASNEFDRYGSASNYLHGGYLFAPIVYSQEAQVGSAAFQFVHNTDIELGNMDVEKSVLSFDLILTSVLLTTPGLQRPFGGTIVIEYT